MEKSQSAAPKGAPNSPFKNPLLSALYRWVDERLGLGDLTKLAAKKTVPTSPGTFPINGLTFACVLLGVIIIIGALTFFPALCLGPIVEQGLMLGGRVF